MVTTRANFRDVSAAESPADVDPRASSRIFAHQPDRVALALLEAQAGWMAGHDMAQLRRALLSIVLGLEE